MADRKDGDVEQFLLDNGGIKNLVNELTQVQGYSPRTVNPEIGFIPGNARKAAEAYVANAAPNTVVVNRPGALGYGAPGYGMAHEVEHTLGNRADLYSGTDNPIGKRFREYLGAKPDGPAQVARENIMAQNLANATGLTDRGATNYLRDFWQAMGNPEVGDHLRKVYGVDPTYLGNPKNNRGLEEGIADLSAIETVKKKDLTEDPFLRKKLFYDDPNLIEAYKSVTGTRTQRLDARDLPPFTAQKREAPSKFEKLKKMLGFKYGGQVKSTNIDKPLSGGKKNI